MNLIKCSNGHFYDASKFQQCPHCNVSNPNTDVTMPVDNQKDLKTVPADEINQDDVATVGMPKVETPNLVQVLYGSPDVMQRGNTPNPVFVPPLPNPKAMTAPTVKNDDDDVKTVGYYHQNQESKEAEQAIDPVVGWLVIINGKKRGTSVQLKAGRNFIGRAASNDIVLPDDLTISREKHAIIVFEPRSQRFLLQPGSSKELFYVNDSVVLDTKEIEAYDTLYIGKTKLVFIPFCSAAFNWDAVFEAEKNEENK